MLIALREPGAGHRNGLVFPVSSSCRLGLAAPFISSPHTSLLHATHLGHPSPPGSKYSSFSTWTPVLTEDHGSDEESHHHPQEPEESLQVGSRGLRFCDLYLSSKHVPPEMGPPLAWGAAPQALWVGRRGEGPMAWASLLWHGETWGEKAEGRSRQGKKVKTARLGKPSLSLSEKDAATPFHSPK